ncbi:hypothetical protein AB5J62_32625 [Amycolatopsis sp. cg5]|uniref:hypothetical protein n=1 Tax=Amycolatopsis sp. cg5 TaxID=3238802 RepID=UPI0035248955
MNAKLWGYAIAAATTTVLAVGLPATASAAPDAVGSVTFYANADGTGAVKHLTYASCAGSSVTVLPVSVAAADNRPSAGCQVSVVSHGRSFVLCAGKSVIPAAYRDNASAVVRAGSSPACPPVFP